MEKSNPQAIALFVFKEIPAITHILHRIQLAASVLHQQGWAEANGGNISLRISKQVIVPLKEAGFTFPEGEWFLVSQTGSRYRDIALDPASGLLLTLCGESDTLFPDTGKPTSEWSCHKQIHKLDSTGSYPCLLHAHPTELIALCHNPIYQDEAGLNRLLAALLPELPLYLKQGIATSPYAKPGSKELAELSCQSIRDRQVLIWDKHGVLCRGADIDQTLDYLEIVNKAAKLFFLVSK